MAGVKGQVQQRGVARRKAILDAAIELFSAHGYRGTGIAAIAERVGITPSGVLHHFGSKEGLLRAVVEERDAREEERLAGFWHQRGLDAIIGASRKLAHDIGSERDLALLYTVLLSENLTEGAPLHDFFKQRTRGIRAGMRNVLEFARQTGEIREDTDVRRTADEIIAFLEGAQLTWLQDPQRLSLVALYESYLDGLVERLAPREAPGTQSAGQTSALR
jgi:AcrR family transcriptional regulator